MRIEANTPDVSTPAGFVGALEDVVQRATSAQNGNLPPVATVLAHFTKAVWDACFLGEARSDGDVIADSEKAFSDITVPENGTTLDQATSDGDDDADDMPLSSLRDMG